MHRTSGERACRRHARPCKKCASRHALSIAGRKLYEEQQIEQRKKSIQHKEASRKGPQLYRQQVWRVCSAPSRVRPGKEARPPHSGDVRLIQGTRFQNDSANAPARRSVHMIPYPTPLLAPGSIESSYRFATLIAHHLARENARESALAHDCMPPKARCISRQTCRSTCSKKHS